MKIHRLIASTAVLIAMLLCQPVIAAQAPHFNLPGDGKTHDLKQLRGQVVYIDFWASWCVPCRKSFPWMNEINKRYAGDGLKVIAINLDADRKDATQFLEKIPANFDIAYDPDGETAGRYDLQVMPSSYLIDRNGELVMVHKGFREGDAVEVEAKIQKLLKSR